MTELALFELIIENFKGHPVLLFVLICIGGLLWFFSPKKNVEVVKKQNWQSLLILEEIKNKLVQLDKDVTSQSIKLQSVEKSVENVEKKVETVRVEAREDINGLHEKVEALIFNGTADVANGHIKNIDV